MATTALLHFNGADASTTITNDVGAATFAAQGNAQIDTAQYKFGGAALLLDGAGDYVKSLDIGALPASGGWTIDCWVRFNTIPTFSCIFYYPKIASGFGAQLYLNGGAGGKLTLSLSSNGTGYDIVTGVGTKSDFTTGVWYHIAFVRDDSASAYYLYVDGVLDKTVSSASQVTSTLDRLDIGAQGLFSQLYLDGWIDEFRISNTCLYPGGTSFTSPTSEDVTGSSYAIFNLPALTFTGSGTFLGFFKDLPMLTLAAGNPSAIFDLPALTLSATGLTLVPTEFDLPALTLVAAGSDGSVGISAFNLPALTLSADGVTSNIGVAEFNLPALLVAVTARQDGLGDAAFNLPFPTLTAIGFTGGTDTAAFDLPMLTLSVVAHQSITSSAAFDLPLFYLDAQGASSIAAAYRTWVLNVRKGALTEYSGFSFNSFAKFNGAVLACGPSGVFVLGTQDTDAGTAITGKYRTGLYGDDSAWVSRVPRAFLAGSQSGDLRFRVITTEGGTREYNVQWNKISGYTQRRIPIGKGIKSRWFQYEVEGVDGANFSTTSLLTYPTKLRRRIAG